MWGGREGTECDAAKDIRLALDRYKEAVDICCAYARDRGYDVRFALEPKRTNRAGNILLPRLGTRSRSSSGSSGPTWSG